MICVCICVYLYLTCSQYISRHTYMFVNASKRRKDTLSANGGYLRAKIWEMIRTHRMKGL